MHRSRAKLFIENIVVYGFGGMISKLIPFFMLPIITRLYPSSEYMGLNDLSTSFIQFASALAVCGMYDAMFRLFFDDDNINMQRKVCSTAMGFVSTTTIVLALLCIIFREQIADWYYGGTQYVKLVDITTVGFLVNSTNQIVSAPTRIQNKRKVFLITNTISPLISYTVAIPLILDGYYALAMPLATAISGLILEISFGIMNASFFKTSSFDKEKLRELLKVGLPLLPNFLVYWVYNSADKLMISQLLGTSATGVYSVASRIGHISNLIYNAFAGGWLYFAYSTMNDDDQVQLKSNIFEYLGAIAFASTVALTAVSKLCYQLFFTEEYYEGYIVAPYLFLAPLLLMLYQVLANQFTIMKKTYLNLLALSAGAILNIILNWVMIPAVGIEGASIATLLGYIISILLCVIILKKMKLININVKVYVNVIVFASFFAVWRILVHDSIILSIIFGIIAECLYIFIYKDILASAIGRLKKKKNRRGEF